MLIVWAGSSAELITYSHQRLPDENVALFLNEPRLTPEAARLSDPRLQEILSYTPEELLDNALEFSSQPSDIPLTALRQVVSSDKIFETHAGVLNYLLGAQPDSTFQDRREEWTQSFLGALRVCLERKRIRLAFLLGRNSDPTYLMLSDMLAFLGLDFSETWLFRETGQLYSSGFSEQRLPGTMGPKVRATDPDVLALLLSYHSLQEISPGRSMNVSAVVEKISSSDIPKLLPSKRSGRSRPGLYKSFKEVAEMLTEAGLLDYIPEQRNDNFKISALGTAYVRMACEIPGWNSEPTSKLIRALGEFRRAFSE